MAGERIDGAPGPVVGGRRTETLMDVPSDLYETAYKTAGIVISDVAKPRRELNLCRRIHPHA